MFFGVWRSLVAHLVWDQGAAGSNPVTPTTTSKQSSLCFDVLFFKERLRLLPCFSFSQKVLRLFGSPVRLAATFLQKSPCAHFAAAPLSRKIVRFFTSLRLRRVFYFVVRFASTFFFSKNVYACSLASPFPKKSYDFSGALPALCVWGGGGQTQQGGR